MTVIATVPEFDKRFPNTGITSADINDVWLTGAEDYLMSKLAEKFVMPPSNSNVTFEQLAYRKAWHLIRLRTLNPDDSDEMGEAIDKELADLMEGKTAMMNSGDQGLVPIFAAQQDTEPQDTVFSTTMTYTPTFDEDDPARQKVDPDLINDLRNRRR